MLRNYLDAAIKNAEYKKLKDGSWYGAIKGFQGVWSNASTVEECRSELIEVLEEWLRLKIKDNDPIPTVDGKNIIIRKAAVLKKNENYYYQKRTYI